MDTGQLISYMGIKWQNIQSNEKIRNNMFGFYIILLGIMMSNYFFNDNIDLDKNNNQTILICLFLWVISLLFLGAFLRYKQILKRDVDIVSIIQNRLVKNMPEIKNRYDYHTEILNKKIGGVSSATTVIILVTIFFSALIFSYGLVSQFGGISILFYFLISVSIHLLIIPLYSLFNPRDDRFGFLNDRTKNVV